MLTFLTFLILILNSLRVLRSTFKTSKIKYLMIFFYSKSVCHDFFNQAPKYFLNQLSFQMSFKKIP